MREDNFTRRQKPNDVDKETPRYDDASFSLDVGVETCAQRHLHIGSRDGEASFAGAEKDPGQNLDGDPCRDGPPDNTERPGELITRRDDLHGRGRRGFNGHF